MSYICMYQGTAQRLEQFITHEIRRKYEIADFFFGWVSTWGIIMFFEKMVYTIDSVLREI